MAGDKEKIDSNDEQENNEGSKLLDLKNEVAQAYIDKIKEGSGYISGLIIGEGDMLKDYLVSEDILDKITDEAKSKFIFQPLKSLLSENIEYNGKNMTIGDYIEEARKELNIANTEVQLNSLKSKIENKKTDIDSEPEKQQAEVKNDVINTGDTKTSVAKTDAVPSAGEGDVVKPENEPIIDKPITTSVIDSNKPKVHNFGVFDKLLVGSVGIAAISQIEIDYVNTEWKKIEGNLEIKGDFVNIDKIKNSKGKTILECKGENPYINKDAIKDLIGLSLFFYKKTGGALTLESAYRNIEQQKKLKKEKGKLAAEPGKSGHNLGLSIDVTSSDRYSKKIGGVKGLQEMAAKFNFNPISSEDWHFDYGKLPESDSRLQLAQNLDIQFENLGLA